MTRTPSLRGRLVVLVGGGLVLLLFAAFLSTALVLEERQEDLIDSLLDEQMEYSRQLYANFGPVPALNAPRMRLYVFPVGRPDATMPVEFRRLGPGDHEVWVHGKEFQLEVVDDHGRRFVLAFDVERHKQEFAELLTVLGIAFLLSSLIAVSGILWLSRHALRHVETLAHAVQQPDEAPFLQPGMEREVSALATALDDYRGRQALLLEREREFSGHLSHELRTPLSVVRAQAELIQLSHADDARLAARAGEIVAQVERMRALIEQLLRLARRTRAPERQSVPLRDLVERIWHDLAQTGPSRTELDDRVPAETAVVADPLLLELILRNALANARLHADGAVLRVAYADRLLEIEDYNAQGANPALPEDGEGLGLAILHRACHLLGWDCELQMLPTGMRLTLRVN